jgi:hypothetical protein
MFKTIQILTLCAGAAALSLPALAQTTPTDPPASAEESGAAVPQGKTSDRTPNATSAGETGTDEARTPEGTSDRTPKENAPASNGAD